MMIHSVLVSCAEISVSLSSFHLKSSKLSNHSVTDSMAHNTNVTTVGSMESIGRVSNRGHGGSEGLSLRDTSVLSLERLGDRLVRCLASRTDSMDQRSSMNHRGSITNGSLWIGSLTIISDLSDITIIIIGVVVDMLDSAVRKSYRVRTLLCASSIT